MPPVITPALRVLWVSLSVTVLVLSLVSFDGRPNSDAGLLLLYSMLVLSFPAGLVFTMLVAGLYAALQSAFSVVVPTSYLEMAFEWTGFFIVGYLQWFRLVPFLSNKVRRRSSLPT